MLAKLRRVLVVLIMVGACLPISSTAVAQSEVALERIEAHAANRPLHSLREAGQRALHRPAKKGPPREVPNFRGEGVPKSGGSGNAADPLLQQAEGAAATSSIYGFPGAKNNDNGSVLGFLVAPPDTDGEVGPNHFVQMINLLTTIYDKNGNEAEGSPFPSNALWEGIGGNCEAYNQGDPIVLYDETADRWLASQFAFPDNLGSFSQCVAISQTGDPAGAFNRYEFSFSNIGFNDYPKHGIVDGSVTMIANLFRKRGPSFSFNGTFLGVIDKAAMYAGQPASLIGFNIGTGQFGFVAGDLDGPGSAPALFATAMSTSSRFDIWRIDVDWSNGNAGATRIAQVPISAFDADLCSASRETCIPQPNNGPALEAISDRLMHRLQVRDFGSYRTMVTAHTVDVGSGRAGIRWYELRETNDTWSLYQQGTFGPADGQHRWMPSAAMNEAGDIGIGYLLASSNTFVSTAVAGQSAAQSGSGQLDSAEQICAAGTGVQTGTGRAGDYSATSIDPVTDTFWHTNEVFFNTGQYQWSTWVCEFSVGDGGGDVNQLPTANFSYHCSGLTCNFTDSSSDSDGTIASRSWNFGDGANSTAQSPSHTYASGGTRTVTLTVTDNDNGTDAESKSVTVTATNDAPTASFTYNCSDLTCNFTDTSTDSDGSIQSRSWNFGDGTTSTATNPSHTYASGGDKTVTLTVTDDDNDTDSASQTVTVTAPSGGIQLSANGYKVRGAQKADLAWSGASTSNVLIKRNGATVQTTANDGAYTDNINNRGGGSYDYQVCESTGAPCSNTVTVSF